MRPYEMDWAGRTNDDHAPLVDFEKLDGWVVTGKQVVATFALSREQQLFGAHVGKLTYRATAARGELRIQPPSPIQIPAPFDAVTLWCYGNNWGYARDASTPPVNLSVALAGADGREFTVPLYTVNWKEWYLLHHRLTPEQIAQVKAGATFKALVVTGIKNTADRVLYFDNLAFFAEQFSPLKFEPRPERNVTPFPGQSPGLNLGPGKLPFPTRPETILPPNARQHFRTHIERDGDAWKFIYAGDDGELVYRYAPRSGRWDDLTATWRAAGAKDSVAFSPCVGGGVQFAADAKVELLSVSGDKESVTARWRLGGVELTYVFRLWNKSLVVDVLAPGGEVSDVTFGRAVGLSEAQSVPVPYYRLQGGHNAVVVAGSRERPLFVMGNVDWYRSNSSALRAAEPSEAAGISYNGGTRYTAQTDGKRNDCFARFFLTIAPRLEEVLPVIDNPVSQWKSVTGTHVWRAHGVSNRTNDAKYWSDVKRLGMTQVVVTDHETGWRDGGESFTFRTRPAPGKGGDEGQADYSRKVHGLGFRYGIYNNYTDYAPVNEHWDEDRVTRTPEGDWRHAWARCYNPKPARAVEFEARLAPIIQQKFQLDTAYCDVHTAVRPWDYVDFDARVPGAGTFAATRARPRRRHVRGGVLRVRRNHAAPESRVARAGVFRRQQPRALLRADRWQLWAGPARTPRGESVVRGFRPVADARQVLQLRHGQSGHVLREQAHDADRPGGTRRVARPLPRRDRRVRSSRIPRHGRRHGQRAAELLSAPATAQPLLPDEHRGNSLRRCRGQVARFQPRTRLRRVQALAGGHALCRWHDHRREWKSRAADARHGLRSRARSAAERLVRLDRRWRSGSCLG
ncbi:MAG: hypothetical protein NTY53_17700 [Kiritimatiellaeota bacterium]|nr:hypothetical protein [Kiritimatiellota bacterium]